MADDVETYLIQARSEQDPFAQAKLIHFLIRERGMKLKDISYALEKKEAYICHLLRLLKLPEIVIDGYYSHLITLSHLFIISRLKETSVMTQVFEEVLSRSLTVGQTEQEVRERLYGIKSKGEYITQHELEELIPDYLRPKIKVIQSRVKSKIIFELQGNLDETSPFVRKILRKMKEVEQ